MIVEGLFAIVMAASQPAIATQARYKRKRYRVIKIERRAPPLPDNGPTVVRSLKCFTPMCSTFDEMWQDRILQWSAK